MCSHSALFDYVNRKYKDACPDQGRCLNYIELYRNKHHMSIFEHQGCDDYQQQSREMSYKKGLAITQLVD